MPEEPEDDEQEGAPESGEQLSYWQRWAITLDDIWWQRPLPWWERFAWLRQHHDDLTDIAKAIFWGLIISEHLLGEDSAHIDRCLAQLLIMERRDAELCSIITGDTRTEEAYELPRSTIHRLAAYIDIAAQNKEQVDFIISEIKRLDGLFAEAWEQRRAAKRFLDTESFKASREYKNKHPYIGLGDSFMAASLVGKRLSYNQYLVYKWHAEGLA